MPLPDQSQSLSGGVDRAVLLLMDGARADVFHRLRAAGELPNLDRYVIGPGGHATATTVFPSLTNVGYASIVTGAHPGRHNVPGGAWLDRARYARWRPSPFRFRQYWGLGHFWHDADLSRGVDTLFEQLAPARNIFGVVGRGTPVHRNAFLLKRIPWALRYLRTGSWAPYDAACARRLMRVAARNDARFIFSTWLQIDEHSHLDGPESPRVLEGYRGFDRMVGELAGQLAVDGSLDRTLIVAATDHGHIAVGSERHFDLVPWLRAQGQRTLTYPFHPRRWFDSDAACFKSGDAMAHIYLKGDGWAAPLAPEHPQLAAIAAGLTTLPAVDCLAYREAEGWVRVRSRRGNARVRNVAGRDEVEWEVGPGIDDPFGYQALPRVLSKRDLLLRTQDSQYPDAPLQLAQLFEAPRCGDIVVSAAPGWDFGAKGATHGINVSSHGSLHRDHMRVPLCMNRPFDTTAPRTVDIAPTILSLMGEATGARCDGVSLVGAPVAADPARRASQPSTKP